VQWSEEDLGRAKISSRAGQRNHSIVKQSSSKGQGLPNVFILKFGILSFEFSTVGIDGKCFEDTANGKPEASNARFPVHLTQVNRDPVEFFHRNHAFPNNSATKPADALDYALPHENTRSRDGNHRQSVAREHQGEGKRKLTSALHGID